MATHVDLVNPANIEDKIFAELVVLSLLVGLHPV